MQHTKRRQAHRSPIGIAEIKITIVLCYYIIIGSVALGTFALNATTSDDFIKMLFQYFTCKSNGSNNLCASERNAYEAFTNAEIGTASFILLGFLPAVNLVYVIGCDSLQHICGKPVIKRQLSKIATSPIVRASTL